MSSFRQLKDVHEHMRKLQETINISKAVLNELEEILQVQTRTANTSTCQSNLKFLETINEAKISLHAQESLSIQSTSSLCAVLKALLAPLISVTGQSGPWEERSIAVKLAQKMQKSKRNANWRKRKRRRVAQLLVKEREDYENIDREADEWRAREIAKNIARRKVESMKEIAKKKANEERKRLESELELALIVEKLQELRSIRIQKLKKQGHFLPEEDDKFLEQVRAAVEEEEQQTAIVANNHTANNEIKDAGPSNRESIKEEEKGKEKVVGGKGSASNDFVVNLPFEFYHYYHGSSYDMGTLIEVRRTWDAYIRPGGSRIPGHWVQPPPPADEVWASYLVRHK